MPCTMRHAPIWAVCLCGVHQVHRMRRMACVHPTTPTCAPWVRTAQVEVDNGLVDLERLSDLRSPTLAEDITCV